MPKPPSRTRRKLLELLAGSVMLPLAEAAAPPLALRRGLAVENLKAAVGLSFVSMPAPTLAEPAAMARTTVGSRLRWTQADGSHQDLPLAYQTFFMTGDWVPDGRGGQVLAGGYYDVHQQPIVDGSSAAAAMKGPGPQLFSDCPDGSSLLRLAQAQVPGVRGHTVFAVVQFEYRSRRPAEPASQASLPAPIAVLTLDQDPDTGRLSLLQYRSVDTAPAHGLWTPCGASLSPWNTHLSSEEYEPDAFKDRDPRLEAFSLNYFGDAQVAKPYHYGHVPELTVQPDGTGRLVKHFCLGRISHELVQVMPDQRTVLMGDDATNGGLFMFVADRAADLSAGTLYVAKWRQTSAQGPGAATLGWIRLGHARSQDIEHLANTLKPRDIMAVHTQDPGDASYRKIRFSGKDNWVRLQPGMAQAAAFLETHRYAALVGGSLGFTKLEGTTVNARDKVAYSAMSYIQTSMVDGSTDIQVQGPTSGAVYALNLRGAQQDLDGSPIDSEWVPVDMAAVPALIGEDLRVPDALGNRSHADKIANPDNLKFSQELRTLFIGEDSTRHVNNFLWAYNVDTQQLSRILSCPAGAESTGLHAVDALNGWTYIMSHFQHPGDWERPLHDKVRDVLDPLVRAHYKDRRGAALGYLTAAAQGIKR